MITALEYPAALCSAHRGAAVADDERGMEDDVALRDRRAAPDAIDQEPHGFVGHVDQRVLGAAQARTQATYAWDEVGRGNRDVTRAAQSEIRDSAHRSQGHDA